MGYPENEELYLTLSRKELQGLCRKHGLPANRSKTELAKMLVVHFTRKKASSKERSSSRKGVGSSKQGRLSGLELRREEPANTTGTGPGRACRRAVDASKADGCAEISFVPKRVENNSILVDSWTSAKVLSAAPGTVYAYLSNNGTEGLDRSTSGSVYVGSQPVVATGIQERQRGYECLDFGNEGGHQKLSEMKHLDKNLPNPTNLKNSSGECSGESALLSSHEISAEVSASFQFFVSSVEGINLYVDMNSSPSDWIKSLKDEVCIYQKVNQDRSWTICNEVRRAGVTDDHLKISSRTDNEISALTSDCARAEFPELVDGGNLVVSSSGMTCSDVQNCFASGSLSCIADMEAFPQNPEGNYTIVNKSNASVPGSSLNKTISNLDVNLSTDSKVSDSMIVNADNVYSKKVESGFLGDSFNSISESSRLSLSEKIQESSKLSETDGIQNGSGTCEESLVNGSAETFLLEAEVLNKKISTIRQYAEKLLLDSNINIVQSGGMESADHLYDEQTCSNLANSVSGNSKSALNEKWVRSPNTKDKENSGCSQNIKMDRTSKRSCNLEVPEDFQSKRYHANSGDYIDAIPNLRSTKTLAGESICDSSVLPRRSGRLVSK